MMISVCLLGYGVAGQAFTKKFKELEYYKLHDGDRTKVRIHTAVVRDNSADKYENVRYVYWREPEGSFCCIKDGTEMTTRETPLCDDIPWLKQTTGHDTVVDFMSYNKEAKDLLLQQISRGYWTHLGGREMVRKHWPEIIDFAKKSGARLSFNMLSTGLDKYKDIDLTQDNFHEYAGDLDLYTNKEHLRDQTIEGLIAYLDKEYWIRLAKDQGWRDLTPEQQQAQLDKEHEEHEKVRLSQPPVPPKYSKNKMSDACGLDDTVPWDKL